MIRVAANARAAATVAAGVIRSTLSGRAEQTDGPLVLALSGGTSPRGLYELLAGDEGDGIPWSRVHLIWGDERCVPPDDPRSNYLMAQQSGLLGRPHAGIHRMPGEMPPSEGAVAYERSLRRLLGVQGPSRGEATDAPPLAVTVAAPTLSRSTSTTGGPILTASRLDLAILGLGQDGHTASLLPGSTVLAEHDRWVAATEPYQGTRRLTLTLPLLAEARCTLFLVTGKDKAKAVCAVLGRGESCGGHLADEDASVSVDRDALPADGDALPARILLDRIARAHAEELRVTSPSRLLKKRPSVVWVLDRAAASELPEAALRLDGSAGRG